MVVGHASIALPRPTVQSVSFKSFQIASSKLNPGAAPSLTLHSQQSFAVRAGPSESGELPGKTSSHAIHSPRPRSRSPIPQEDSSLETVYVEDANVSVEGVANLECSEAISDDPSCGYVTRSLSKTHEYNPLPRVQVDWLSLSDEEFEESLEAISSEFGPDFSRMDYAEFCKFCTRRGEYVGACFERLSQLLGKEDLYTPWKKWRNEGYSWLACEDGDYEESELPVDIKESQNSDLKTRTSNNTTHPSLGK